MEVVVGLLLLVSMGLKCAGAAPGLQRNVTSLWDTFAVDAQFKDSQGTAGIRVVREIPSLAVEHGPLSVVQDWSLVCVQLCGAGLGGGPCAPYCTSVMVPVSVQESNAEILLSPNKDVICEDLCTLKLGGSFCTCSRFASARSIQTRNQVCQTFCLNNSETLAGCSLCNIIQPLREWIEMDVDVNPNNTVSANSTNSAADGAGVTTPDWDALCVSLCKTNDGGSLCNCDLIPFF